ncbi:S8 family serine peptidase [Catenulispora subtropica]|uniref:Type VII secretion-associated serine protease mycosin n=1 Tax=Catenulispora subtropica TaxID=450798 RepID=A0ABP5DSQ3_9ACTN
MDSRYHCRARKRRYYGRVARAAILGLILTPPLSYAAASTETQWALQYLKANEAWKITRGANVKVAVVDTGVWSNANVQNLLNGADFSDASGTNVGNGLVDSDAVGHGTGEAVLIAGTSSAGGDHTVGLAPEAPIVPVRASDGTHAGWPYGAAPAIEYAISHNCRVINLAFTLNLDTSEVHRAIQDAVEHDVVVVAAVGNDGTSQQYYPAAWPGVVGVGAIDSSGKVWARSNTGADVDLVAPGVHILRDDNRGRVGYSDGTSEATAYVSAAAALVRSAHPGWSAAEVVAALVGTADKPPEMRGAVRDDRYGAGILDVLAAVSLTRPPGVVGEGARQLGGVHGGRDVRWWVVGAVGLVTGAGVVVFGVVRRRSAG